MSTLDANADELRAIATHSAATAEPAAGPLTGDPAALGLPSFIVGSVALGLALVGVVPASAVGAALPVILAATSIGLFAAAIWAAALGKARWPASSGSSPDSG